MKSARTAAIAWAQASPLAAVFALFFVVPLALVLVVSFWQATEYELLPALASRSPCGLLMSCDAGLPSIQ